MIDPQAHLVVVDRPAGHEVLCAGEGRVEAQLLAGFWLRAELLWQDPLPAMAGCLTEILLAAAR